jgi:1-acyl-sn-glycerol-3-phosphate acyltransferase
LVLSATVSRKITFVAARELYRSRTLKRLFKMLDYIQVTRGRPDIKAVRRVLSELRHGKVVGLFPEGGIDEYRKTDGHLGIGYLALKTGVPIVPAFVAWEATRRATSVHALFIRRRARVSYGNAITVGLQSHPSRESIRCATAATMAAIESLRWEAAHRPPNS